MNRFFFPFFLFILITLGLNHGVLNADFVWDDWLYVDALKQMSSEASDWLTFISLNPYQYFRPLAFLSILIEAKIFGLTSLHFHVTGLILFILTGMASIALGMLLCRNDKRIQTMTGVATGFIFATHAANSEVASWVSGRFDLMMGGFILAIMIFALMTRNEMFTWKTPIITIILALCASMSKDSTIIMLPLLIIPMLVWKSGRGALISGASLIGVSLGMIIRQHYLLPLPDGVTQNGLVPLQSLGLEVKLSVWLQGASNLWTTVLFPFVFANPYKVPDLNAGFSLGDIIITASAALVVLFCIGKGFSEKEKNQYNSFCWFALAFTPAYCLIHPIIYLMTFLTAENHVADRFLFAPLCVSIPAFCALLIGGLTKAPSSIKKAFLAFFFMWGVASGVMFHGLASVWSNEISFWGYALDNTSNAVTPAASYIGVLNSTGNFKAAVKVAEKVLPSIKKYDAIHAPLLNNAAVSFYMEGDKERAKNILELGVKEKIANGTMIANLAKFTLASGDFTEAVNIANFGLSKMEATALTANDFSIIARLKRVLAMSKWMENKKEEAEALREETKKWFGKNEEEDWSDFISNPYKYLNEGNF